MSPSPGTSTYYEYFHPHGNKPLPVVSDMHGMPHGTTYSKQILFHIFQTSRENANLTREAAEELLKFITEDRIEKIEIEKTFPHPGEILSMAEGYKNPTLCNYYCSHECPIGQKYVPKLELKNLSLLSEIAIAIDSLQLWLEKAIADGKYAL